MAAVTPNKSKALTNVIMYFLVNFVGVIDLENKMLYIQVMI